MKKIMIFFFAFLLLGLISCQTSKKAEKTTMQKIMLDSSHTLYDMDDVNIEIEYPSLKDVIFKNHNSEDNNDTSKMSNIPPSTSKNPNLKLLLNNVPMVPGIKIKYQHIKKRSITDSINKDIDSKDDERNTSRKPTKPYCQYVAFLTVFILFFCLVVTRRKKNAKKFGETKK